MSWQYFNENPCQKSVGDCAVRAVSKALGQTWEQTYVELCLEGFIMADLPNSDGVWSRYLRRHGFKRYLIPDECPDCMTVERFAEENPEGVFVLSMPGRHVVTVIDGQFWDSWDSSNEVPEYYFAKEDDHALS